MQLETHIVNSLGALGKQMKQQLISLNAAVNGNSLLSDDRASVHFLDSVKKTHANFSISSLHRKGRLWDQQLEEGGDGGLAQWMVWVPTRCCVLC